ncbi:MAG: hypothetical protein PF487_07070, partial [Bacteroidales bacterium]|nr:hypothetical protein [Bacteroidales bacterium]
FNVLSINDIINKINDVFVKRKIFLDKKFVVFLFFVLLSTIFWLFKQLEQEYYTDISYPVRFTNIPKNKIIVSDLPSSISVKVRSHGFHLIKLKITNSLLPFNIDLNNLLRKQLMKNKSIIFLF